MLRGCGMLTAGIIFILVVTVVVGLLVFVIRYENWMRQNKEHIQSVAVDDVANRDTVRYELDNRLEEFQTSAVQKESVTLTCDMMVVLVEDVLQESWKLDRSNTGLTCGDRTMTVYVKLWDMWWVTVKIWQRAEGSVEFVVYDVNIGPFSIAGATFGYLSEEISRGVGDAIALVSSESYSGRKIEKLYMEENGMRMVGVVEKDRTEKE